MNEFVEQTFRGKRKRKDLIEQTVSKVPLIEDYALWLTESLSFSFPMIVIIQEQFGRLHWLMQYSSSIASSNENRNLKIARYKRGFHNIYGTFFSKALKGLYTGKDSVRSETTA